MSSGRLIDYLGAGTAAARPVSLSLYTGTIGIYFATDTLVFTIWNGSAWTQPSVGSNAVWGSITGTLSSQIDLYNSLGFAGINTQTGTTYTLVLSDQNKLIQGNNAAAITFTVPPNSSVALPLNTTIYWQQYGAGLITLAPGVGVTIRSPNGLTSNTQYSVRALMKIGTDEWVIP